MTPTTARIVRTETTISVIINAVISAVMFAIVFGFAAPVPVRGSFGFATDFLPQVFMVSLMGSLVPALLTMGRHQTRGAVRFSGLGGPGAIMLRSLIVAIVSAIVIGGGLALAFWTLAPSSLATLPALAIKVATGAVVAIAITPSGVRHALSGMAA